MAKDCLYCGLQFSDTTHFCPNCGRPTERGFIILPHQESELDRRRQEIAAMGVERAQRSDPPGGVEGPQHRDVKKIGRW
ncbi:MAG TPA: hypothetical protein VF043_25625 [Ktedonobacteraceae bacterium]